MEYLLSRTTDRAFDFLIGRKHIRQDRQVKVSFRELKAQIYWPATDQKVRGSNPCGRTQKYILGTLGKLSFQIANLGEKFFQLSKYQLMLLDILIH